MCTGPMTRYGSALSAILVVAILLLAAAGCSPGAGGDLRLVDSPAVKGSSAPNLALGLDGRVYLSWIEPAGDDRHAFRFSVWNEAAWSEPRTIATGSDWFVNWADLPSVAALADGTLAAHWLVKSDPKTYAYDIHLAVSRDGGETWTKSGTAHTDGTHQEHGFVSLVPMPEGEFVIVWLDGRQMEQDGGAMTLRTAVVSPTGRVASERLVDDRVCDCCQTDAARTPDGSVLVVYRDRSPEEVRDILSSSLQGGNWSTPRLVHSDGWEIHACPVNGPALAIAGDRVATAWFTVTQETARVRLAFSTDGGLSFGEPIRIDTGDPIGRVDLTALGDGSVLVSWMERAGEQADILVRRVSPSGEADPVRVVTRTSSARSSGVPRMARMGDDVLVAWTEAGEPSRVRTALLERPTRNR